VATERVRCLAAGAIGLMALAAGAAAQTGPRPTGPHPTGPHAPAPGSAERKAILHAVRRPVARMLEGPVVFAISFFRVQGRRAFLIAVPRRPDGSAIDYSDTKWGDAARRMEFKDEIVALIYRHGVKAWRVVW
jgi:hypothetical protein